MKLNIVLAKRCCLFTNFPDSITPRYFNVVFTLTSFTLFCLIASFYEGQVLDDSNIEPLQSITSNFESTYNKPKKLLCRTSGIN